MQAARVTGRAACIRLVHAALDGAVPDERAFLAGPNVESALRVLEGRKAFEAEACADLVAKLTAERPGALSPSKMLPLILNRQLKLLSFLVSLLSQLIVDDQLCEALLGTSPSVTTSTSYSPLSNCSRSTRIQSGPQKGRATLKNVATLIRAKREKKVADAYILGDLLTISSQTHADASFVPIQNRWSDA